MRIRNLHSWEMTPVEARKMQDQLATRIDRTSRLKTPQWIAGADISFNKKDPVGYAGVVLLNAKTLEIEAEFTHIGRLPFPYIPGLLSFREAPLLLKIFEKVEPKPQLVFFDGQGIAHPRRLGLASHLGLFLDCPTIGCAKTRYIGKYDEPASLKGNHSKLMDDNGEIIGKVVRTRDECKPVFISIGHKIDLSAAVNWTLKCTTRYRIPEPTRQAHLLVNRLRREHTIT